MSTSPKIVQVIPTVIQDTDLEDDDDDEKSVLLGVYRVIICAKRKSYRRAIDLPIYPSRATRKMMINPSLLLVLTHV